TFASGGNMELLRRWVQEGMATPAEDMARAAEAIMFHGMEFLKGEPLPPGEEEHAMSPAPAGGEERKDVPT
ncbi:MAG TPA: TetR family transcriptional regulator C-terminal domain-containing protein, partial [Candidatus Acutalibacter ornithocaccae]|nr:TetR family transcriptional regulator C-terminal domain-containing protein [Candidatus Acutalibacter ornithocaccae]